MNAAQTEAVAQADAHTSNAALPTYTDLLNFAQRMAYPQAGELLILDDYRNIARNIVQPSGVKIERGCAHENELGATFFDNPILCSPGENLMAVVSSGRSGER